jgi:hypothetical protein
MTDNKAVAMTRALKSGLIFLALYGLAASARPAQPGARPASTMNLVGCAWRASVGARVTIRAGTMDLSVKSLPRPEPRTVECEVPLPGNRQMEVQGTHRGAVTEQGWTFSFVRSTGERVLLNHSSQEGDFAFPVPSSWQHDKRVGVVIGIPGDNPGYSFFQVLRLQSAPVAVPAAPQLVSPLDGQQVTPPSADFLWTNPNSELVSSYELEWQRKGGKSRTKTISAYFISSAQGTWTANWLAPGKYTWRVRASNSGGFPGPWSKARHFTVRRESSYKAPDIHPSAQKPLFLVDMEASDPGPKWDLIPADVQSHLLIRIGGPIDLIQHMLDEAQRERIPIALQVNGPHDIIAGRWDRLPLAVVARWAQRHSELKAFYICEQQVQGGIANPEVKTYLERLIALGAEVGRPVFWADANWGGNVWLSVVASRDFAQFARQHQGYLYPLWKMNGGFVPYLAPAGLLGLWLKGTVAAWGVQPETWYWTEAGFRTLGVQRDYKEGLRQDAPPVLFQELASLGASAGAEIYSFEPGTDIFDANSGRNLQMILVPLVRMLTDSGVPDLQEVKTAVVKEHTLGPADLLFRKGYTRSLRKLFSNTLGIAYPFEMVPESGNCYWIPFIPAGSASASSSKPCSAPVPGRAAIFKAGGTDFIFNSRVNWPGEQQFSLDLAGTRMSGKLGLNGWVVVRNAKDDAKDEESRLWFFARTGALLDMQFERPVVWRKHAADDPRTRLNEKRSATSGAWSTPVHHIEFRAQDRPWDVLIRSAGAL